MLFYEFIGNGVTFWKPHMSKQLRPIQTFSILVSILMIAVMLNVGVQIFRINRSLNQLATELPKISFEIKNDRLSTPNNFNEINLYGNNTKIQLQRRQILIGNQSFSYSDIRTATKIKKISNQNISQYTSILKSKILNSFFIFYYIFAIEIVFLGIFIVSVGSLMYRVALRNVDKIPITQALYTAATNIVVPLVFSIILTSFDAKNNITIGIFMVSYFLCLFIVGRVQAQKLLSSGVTNSESN